MEHNPCTHTKITGSYKIQDSLTCKQLSSYLIGMSVLFMQVSPSTHGAPQQVLPSTSSGSSVPQPFKGMREEEVQFFIVASCLCMVLWSLSYHFELYRSVKHQVF